MYVRWVKRIQWTLISAPFFTTHLSTPYFMVSQTGIPGLNARVCVCVRYHQVAGDFFRSYETNTPHSDLFIAVSSSWCMNIRGKSFKKSSHLALCLSCLLVPSTLPNIIPSSIPQARIVCPKKVSACLTVMPFNEISGFTSTKRDLFFLLAVHRIHSILRKHRSSNASTHLLPLSWLPSSHNRTSLQGKLMPSLSALLYVLISLCLSRLYEDPSSPFCPWQSFS